MTHITFESQFQQLVERHLPKEIQQHPDFTNFINAVHALSAQREKKQLEHAFHIGEISSKMLNEQITTLEKSEENYRNIVEKSNNIIYKTNGLGQFIYVNTIAEQITGFEMKELLDRHFLKLVRPDKRNEVLAFYMKQVAEQKAASYYEFPIVTKSGKEKWIGQNVQINEDNLPSIGFTAVAIDITERVTYERLMLLQKEKYQNIINNMNLGLLEVDQEERIQFANPRFSVISGYSNEELIGKKATELFVKESHIGMVKQKALRRTEGISDMYEVPVHNKAGESRWWIVSGAPNYDNNGNFTGSIGIHLDITDQKKTEIELELAKSRAEESSKAKELFLSNMSHEIRTPLNAIIGMIRALSKFNLPEHQNTYVRNTILASQHLLSILNNVLDISKIDAGEHQLDQHDFNLLNTLKDVKTIMIGKAAEKGLYLKLNQLENRSICLYGDSGRVRQILINLVGNAIKFTETGGITITYSVEIKQPGFKTISIHVCDTGIGMEAAFIKNLFNKFSQEDASISRKYGGSGLGMTITHELISLMNGTIDVKSKKNMGTTVSITFLLPVGDPTKLVEDTPIYLSALEESLEILLVEDNEFNRMVALDTLRKYKCIVTEAINGEQAIELLKEGKRFDVILMDLQMPVMNGFDATWIIRNQLQIQTPIIALTANAFKSELEKCIRIGMNDYVTKPFEEDKLLSTIFRIASTHVSINNEKKEIKQTPAAEKLFDLRKLETMSGGDQQYVKKMVNIFINQSETSILQFKEFYNKGDLESIYQLAHRIKPSIDGMGIQSLHKTIRSIEKTAQEKKNSSQLFSDVNLLCDTLKSIIAQLKHF